jgi:putative addiction module component (TIGR02574 family)
MSVSIKELGIDRLGTEERLSLIGELWDSLNVEAAAIPVTDSQKHELQSRLADHRRNQDDVVAWDDVKTSLTKRLQG